MTDMEIPSEDTNKPESLNTNYTKTPYFDMFKDLVTLTVSVNLNLPISPMFQSLLLELPNSPLCKKTGELCTEKQDHPGGGAQCSGLTRSISADFDENAT